MTTTETAPPPVGTADCAMCGQSRPRAQMTDDGLMWLCGAEPGANATQQEKDAYVREVADCTERWERREKGGAEKAAEPAQAAPEAEPQPGGPQEAQDGAEDAAGPGENT